jgi:predicted Zn-dependent peptidase
VVLQEIKMVEDTPDDLIHDLFAEHIWAGHPLGRPILGRRETVQGFSREVILAHFGEQYVPGRIVIAVAGNLEHERVVSLFSPHFEGFGRPTPAYDGSPPPVRGGVEMVPKNLEQVQMIIGFPGLKQSARERHALYLLNDVIGGSVSSRLFQEVRERQGLVYSIYSGSQGYRDTGVLYIYAASDSQNFSKVLKGTLKELRGLKKDGVTPEELGRAKEHLKGNLMLSLESTASRMNRLAKQELYFGSFFSLDEMLATIDAVREEEVQALVHQLLDEDQMALLTLGPLDRRHLPKELGRP